MLFHKSRKQSRHNPSGFHSAALYSLRLSPHHPTRIGLVPVGVPGDRRSGRRPRRPALRRPVRGAARALGRPRRAQPSEARSGWHWKRNGGKLDPSRGRADALGTRAGGRDDPHALRETVGGDDWPHGAAGGGIFHDIAGCNTAGRDHNGGRDKTPRRREESDTHAGEKLWNRPQAPVSRGSARQPAPIMAG